MSFLDGGGTDGAGNYDMSQVPSTSTYGSNPPVVIQTNYGDNFSPGNLTQGATSFLDVLKYGFGRVVDYQTASLQAANTQPQYQQQQPKPLATVPASMSTGTVIMIGAAVLAFILLTGDKKG